jgi:hypothetical protein
MSYRNAKPSVNPKGAVNAAAAGGQTQIAPSGFRDTQRLEEERAMASARLEGESDAAAIARARRADGLKQVQPPDEVDAQPQWTDDAVNDTQFEAALGQGKGAPPQQLAGMARVAPGAPPQQLAGMARVAPGAPPQQLAGMARGAPGARPAAVCKLDGPHVLERAIPREAAAFLVINNIMLIAIHRADLDREQLVAVIRECRKGPQGNAVFDDNKRNVAQFVLFTVLGVTAAYFAALDEQHTRREPDINVKHTRTTFGEKIGRARQALLDIPNDATPNVLILALAHSMYGDGFTHTQLATLALHGGEQLSLNGYTLSARTAAPRAVRSKR